MRGSSSFWVYICIVGIVVHCGVELNLSAVPEWVADGGILAQPIAKLNDRRFVRCEVYELMPGQDGKHIEVVCQLPVHAVCAYLCTQVRRVNQEHNIRSILVLLEYLFVVSRNDGDTLEVVR